MQNSRKTLSLSETVLGELYESFSEKEMKELDRYITKLYSTKQNHLVRLHHIFTQKKFHKELEVYSMLDIQTLFLQNNMSNYTLFMTYVHRLAAVLKEFIIWSKIDSKNVHIQALWSEHLIEKKMKRNLILNQSNYKLNNKSEYLFQSLFLHYRESVFLYFLGFLKDKNNDLKRKLLRSIRAFEDYTIFQSIEDYKSLASMTDWYKGESKKKNQKILSDLIERAKNSENEYMRIYGLSSAVNWNLKSEHYDELYNIFLKTAEKLNLGIQYTIGMALINNITRRQVFEDESLTVDSYNLLSLCYNRGVLLYSNSQNHILLGTYIVYELLHGSTVRARKILAESLRLVNPPQRDSCEKLCLARIEFSEKNYYEALFYVDQGSTSVSRYYYPLFKSLLLKILVMIEDEIRFCSELENLYKYLHKNVKIDSGVRNRFLLFHKYIDQVQTEKFKQLSNYRKRKLEEALVMNSPYFHDKEWMRSRFESLSATLP